MWSASKRKRTRYGAGAMKCDFREKRQHPALTLVAATARASIAAFITRRTSMPRMTACIRGKPLATAASPSRKSRAARATSSQ
jgi:hypothetical protein